MFIRSAITHQFNVLWINPNDVDSIPKGLMDGMLEYIQGTSLVPFGRGNEATRLRDQMRADALQPVASDEDDNDHNGMNKATQQEEFPAETVEEAVYFFRLRVCRNACPSRKLTFANVASRSAEFGPHVPAR